MEAQRNYIMGCLGGSAGTSINLDPELSGLSTSI